MTKFFIFSDLKKTKKTVLVADGFVICLLPGPFFISQKKGVRKMIGDEIAKAKRNGGKLLSAKTVPIDKVCGIIRMAIQKQFPNKQFKAVKFELWGRDNVRWEKMWVIL